jgi:hypothetical protein
MDKTLEEFKGDKSVRLTAALLGVDRQTVYAWMDGINAIRPSVYRTMEYFQHMPKDVQAKYIQDARMLYPENKKEK